MANVSDLWFTSEGDFLVGYDCDLLLANDLDMLLQSIAIRVKTLPGEMALHPEVGVEMMDLIGAPMNEETLALGEMLIYNNLTYDGLFNPDDITVAAAPINKYQALFIVEVMAPELDRERLFVIPYDFQEGRVLTDEIHEVIGQSSVYTGGLL